MMGYHDPRWIKILPKPEPVDVVSARREKAAADQGMSLAEYEAWQEDEVRKAKAAEPPDAWDCAL